MPEFGNRSKFRDCSLWRYRFKSVISGNLNGITRLLWYPSTWDIFYSLRDITLRWGRTKRELISKWGWCSPLLITQSWGYFSSCPEIFSLQSSWNIDVFSRTKLLCVLLKVLRTCRAFWLNIWSPPWTFAIRSPSVQWSMITERDIARDKLFT